MYDLAALLAKMEQGLVVEKVVLATEEIESALEQRDDACFDSPWMEVYKQIEAAKHARGVTGDADPRVGRLREVAYLKSFERWNSPDLAGDISDDFGLIGDALALAYTDPWLQRLLGAYFEGRLPRGLL